jgi:hypothetical protein
VSDIDLFDEQWIDINFKLYEPHQDDFTVIEVEKRGVGRPMSEPSEITDITSTGRKRAAMMYPIFKDMNCEWGGLKYAGGGVVPIIGCAGSVIQPTKGPDKGDRHHGPDKNVINNAPNNVHRICSTCHNRWHALNNKYYGERPPADEPYLPLSEHEWKEHDPVTQATEEEIAENEEWWSTRRKLLVNVDTE